MFKLFVWWKAPGYSGRTRQKIERKPIMMVVGSQDEAIVELRKLVKVRSSGLIVYDHANLYRLESDGRTIGAIAASWQDLPAAPRKPATEPTAAGLQYIMPGCEKDQTRGPAQMSLF